MVLEKKRLRETKLFVKKESLLNPCISKEGSFLPLALLFFVRYKHILVFSTVLGIYNGKKDTLIRNILFQNRNKYFLLADMKHPLYNC